MAVCAVAVITEIQDAGPPGVVQPVQPLTQSMITSACVCACVCTEVDVGCVEGLCMCVRLHVALPSCL